MRRTLECGCFIEDARLSTVHDDSVGRSTGDVEQRRHHYPLGRGSATFCGHCDLIRPCPCDVEARAAPPSVKLVTVVVELATGDRTTLAMRPAPNGLYLDCTRDMKSPEPSGYSLMAGPELAGSGTIALRVSGEWVSQAINTTDRNKAEWQAREAELKALLQRAMPSVQFVGLVSLVDEMNIAITRPVEQIALRELLRRTVHAAWNGCDARGPGTAEAAEKIIDVVLGGR